MCARMSSQIGALILVVVGTQLLVACGLPSDRELIDNFLEHRQEFDSLVNVVKQNSQVRRITMESVSPPGSLPPERWADFRDLCEKLGIAKGVTNWGPGGPIVFAVATRGLLTGGAWKGYAYSEEQLGQLYDSLDDRPSGSLSNVPVYRAIDSGWYVVYAWDD